VPRRLLLRRLDLGHGAAAPEHQTGAGATYTRRRRPVRLVWHAFYDSIAEAYAMEKRVQGWSRAKRRALIQGRYGDLSELASRPRWSAFE